MAAAVTEIYRFPVKSLSGESLPEAEVGPGMGVPHDRRFAIARGTSRSNGGPTVWQSRSCFFTLADVEKLAQLRVDFDPETGSLTLSRHGKAVTRAQATDPMGRLLLGQFLSAFLAGSAQATPRLVEAKGFMFTDCEAPLVSIVNLASLRDLKRVVGGTVDPLRFRANFYIDGPAAWAELGWPGRRIELGSSLLEVVKPMPRGAATNVDPQSGERNLNIPLALQRGFGHCRVGVYAKVVRGGKVAKGDRVAAPQ